TRLLLTHARNETPAIADEKIVAPLVITGPPRSGTSILFELLALDPNARAPLAWEVLHPLPFDGATEAARRAMGECEQEFWPTCSRSSRRSTSCARICPSSA
ncbi:MAG: hypothetical protein V3U03_01740, partial [Myxococcota bacterium]